jgi:hypothetical protein
MHICNMDFHISHVIEISHRYYFICHMSYEIWMLLNLLLIIVMYMHMYNIHLFENKYINI